MIFFGSRLSQSCRLAPGGGDPDQDLFEEALLLARSRAEALKYQKDNPKTLSEAAEPKHLKDEKHWYDFTDQLFTYLSAIPGVKGVPLAYVIRAQAEPDHDRDWEHDAFNERMIACAPLEGTAFTTDAPAHLLIWTLIESEELLLIIQPSKRRKNGRTDYLTLKEPVTAKQIKQNLHYRNERAMKFSSFMTKFRHMHRIYQDEGRPMSADEKIEDLLKKIKAPFVIHQKANLESLHNMGTLTFNQAANIFASVVASSPAAKLSSNISEVNSNDSGDGQPSVKLRRPRGGGIDVDYSYPEGQYKKLSHSDKNSLRLARKKAGKWGGSRRGQRRKCGDRGTLKVSEVMHIVKETFEAQASGGSTVADNADNDSEAKTDNAGTLFGGRHEKKQKHSS